MTGRIIRYLAWLSPLAMLIAGCQSGNVAVVSPANAAASASASTTSASTTLDTAEERPAKMQSAVDEFTPPFPHRADPFEPPQRASNVVRRDDEYGGTVELKGFIDVEGPQAVLAINGVISPIAEGSEKYGVKVISIQPPKVVLQRGRSRWTASLD